MTIIPNSNENDNAISKCCETFFKRFHLGKLLRKCNASKEKGISVNEIFSFLLGLVFTRDNLYTLLSNVLDKVSFSKDVVYRFLNSLYINWERFLFLVASAVLPDIQKLTSEDRKNVLIIDDSPFYRNRSKKVELLSRCYDHVTHKYYKGLTMLTIGWSDGQSFLPLIFRLLASNNSKNLLVSSQQKCDKRTLATWRRENALKDKPTVVLDMLRFIKGTVAQTQYVLFDSWFASPSALLSIKELKYDVVARLKNLNTFQYLYKNEKLPISKIYTLNRKRRGKSKYLLSVLIEITHKDFKKSIPAKLVYVRDKNNSKKWIALVSTDIELTEEEIIELYGKRWDIEPFFKMCKSYLNLAKEFQGRSYDGMIAHTTIVFVRYILLSLENRNSKDDRTVCELFFVMCKELEDISFAYAFELIKSTMIQSATEYLHLSSVQIEDLLTIFIDQLPLFIKGKLKLSVCES